MKSWAGREPSFRASGVLVCAPALAQITQRASVSSTGTQGNSHSEVPFLSADGRFVVFESLATNLAPGDTNGSWDVFVRDMERGITERVSVASNGAQGNGDSENGAISADGRFVTFWSRSTNLVAGDTNEYVDVFVRDRHAGTTERVSRDGRGQGNADSSFPTISQDGRYVAFQSGASDLVPGIRTGPWTCSSTTGRAARPIGSASTDRSARPTGGPRFRSLGTVARRLLEPRDEPRHWRHEPLGRRLRPPISPAGRPSG
jgi:Tol biopolymer transport system component